MELRVIACVQPCCGTRTSDFYNLKSRGPLSPVDVLLGDTCKPCYEAIQARITRELTLLPPRPTSSAAE